MRQKQNQARPSGTHGDCWHAFPPLWLLPGWPGQSLSWAGAGWVGGCGVRGVSGGWSCPDPLLRAEGGGTVLHLRAGQCCFRNTPRAKERGQERVQGWSEGWGRVTHLSGRGAGDRGTTSDLGGGGAVGSSERVRDGGGEDPPALGTGSPKRWLHCTPFHLQAQRCALWNLNEMVVTFTKHPQNSEIHMERMLPGT